MGEGPALEVRLLIATWVVAALLRLSFLALYLRDPGRLWDDYERAGPLFSVARWLDRLTWAAVVAVALWTLAGLTAATPRGTLTVFLVWFGVSLLTRFPVHRFPRTNVPGAWHEATTTGISQLVLAMGEALLAGAAVVVYFWWRG